MAVCNSFTNAFDLECLFVNIFSGSPNLFIFVALLFIVILGARFRMFAGVLGVSLILFAILIYPIASWFAYVAVPVGLIFSALAIASALKR